jgi:hypothetical protein
MFYDASIKASSWMLKNDIQWVSVVLWILVVTGQVSLMAAVTVLMVAEKPSLALSIAGQLSGGRVRHCFMTFAKIRGMRETNAGICP